MAILTADALLARKSPDPLTEVFSVEELCGEVRIEGLRLYKERDAVYTEIDALKEQGQRLKVTSANGEVFVPNETHVVAACWAAACVAEPKMTSYQWLVLAGTEAAALMAIFARCMVCSRLAEDKQTKTPDGLDAAKAEAEDGGDDPLGRPGGDSA